MEAPLYSTLLADARLHRVLDRIDADLAATTKSAGCRCSGSLHHADYPRKPRAPFVPLPSRRASFCCAVDGCRARATPPSVRFFGRKVYLGAVVVLATALRHGPTPVRLARLHADLGVSARTLARWRVWWREVFVESAGWKAARARFVPPVDTKALPASVLERFAGDLVRCLEWLAPLVT
jgi:hypothetical protein